MTKGYLGNDEYEIIFDSGVTTILSEADINELVADSDFIDDLKEDLQIANDEITPFNKAFKKLQFIYDRFNNSDDVKKDVNTVLEDVDVILEYLHWHID